MQVERIYFDMDGVLADFAKGTEDYCHIPIVEQGHSTTGQDDALFNSIKQVPHFYYKLEPIQGMVELFKSIFSKYGDKCEILTGIPKPHRGIVDAAEDKANWVREILSANVKVNIVYRAEKKEYCNGPSYILIDDYDCNIFEWEQMGGCGVLFKSADQLMNRLKELDIL